jgi:hypothetical protein
VAVNQLVVKALTQTYTRAQLETARATAAADVLAGVQVTQVNFEGGGASGRPISGDPSYVLEHIQSAIDQMDDATLAAQPSCAYFDLSKRTFGT